MRRREDKKPIIADQKRNPPRGPAPMIVPRGPRPTNAARGPAPTNIQRGSQSLNAPRNPAPVRAPPRPRATNPPVPRFRRLDHPPFPNPPPVVKKTVNLQGEFTLEELNDILNMVTPKPSKSRVAQKTPRDYPGLESDLQRQELSSMNKLRLMRRDIWESQVLTRQMGKYETEVPHARFDEKAYRQAMREERLRAMRKKPVLNDKSTLQYFKSPPNRLPASWALRPGTPLQHIYGNIVNNLPTRGYSERRKGVLQAVENGFMYRHIKDAQKKSIYSRKAQLKDFKKHEAFVKCRRPVANIEKFNEQQKKRNSAQGQNGSGSGTAQRKPSFPSMAADKRRPGTAISRKGTRGRKATEVPSEQKLIPPADQKNRSTRESKPKEKVESESGSDENLGDVPREGRDRSLGNSGLPRRVRRKTPHPRCRKTSSSSDERLIRNPRKRT